MYFVILGLMAARDMEGASWACRGRTMRRGVVKIGVGSWGLESWVETWDAVVLEWAGVGCAAMAAEVQRVKCRLVLWWLDLGILGGVLELCRSDLAGL